MANFTYNETASIPASFAHINQTMATFTFINNTDFINGEQLSTIPPETEKPQPKSNPFLPLDGMLSYQKDLVYLFFVFLIGALVRHATDILRLPLPYTVVIFFIGCIAGCLPLGKVYRFGPHGILYIFMPILIFEGSFSIDTYIFRQIFIQVLILAAPALVVITFLLAGVGKFLFTYDWDLSVSLLFGSILAATDPVAVVAIMKELGTSKRLSLLIEGESMLNDGTAIVFFTIVRDIVIEGTVPTASKIIFDVLWVACGGYLFGYFMAQIAVFWLQWTFNDSLTEIAITLSAAYLVFYIADAYLHVSAVLAVVILGCTLSEHRTSISPEVEIYLHSFWETLAFMANTLIFAICGFIITREVLTKADFMDFIFVIMLYFAVQVTRGFAFLMFSPLLQRLGYGLSWQDGLVATWSGLRGAVGLALALMVFQSEDEELKKTTVGPKILFHVSLIVVATLMINATTVSFLLQFLGLTDVTPARRQAMKKAIQALDDSRRKMLNVWKIDRFLADADWDAVNRICIIEDPFKSSETYKDKEQEQLRSVICPRCNLPVPYAYTASELHAMRVEAYRKYLKLLKQNFWLQFEKGLLAGFSVRKLIELAEEAADRECELIAVEEIKSIWRYPQRITDLKKILANQTVTCNAVYMSERRLLATPAKVIVTLLLIISPFIATSKMSYCKPISARFQAFQLTTESKYLVLLVFGLDLLIMTLMFIEMGLKEMEGNIWQGLVMTDFFICIILVLFFIFRFLLFRKQYVRTIWFWLNLLCAIQAGVQVVRIQRRLERYLFSSALQMSDVKDDIFFVQLGSIRFLQFLEPFILFTIVLMNRYIRARLTTGCDVARGFVRANEFAIRLIDHLSDNPQIQNLIKSRAEFTKISILRELGLLQGLHPDIALGVKTHQAMRSVLNVMREGMQHLMDEGGIDEPEGLLFIKVIESKMKRLMASPPTLQIPSRAKILAAIPWIDKEDSLVESILSLARKINFGYGDVILKAGDSPSGIYIITSGLVKVESPLNLDFEVQELNTLDFMSTGNVIGEMSALTGKTQTSTFTCETIVKTLFISMADLNWLFHQFSNLHPPLLARMWKVCAVRIALHLLYNASSHHGLRKEALLARLEDAELEHVDESNEFLISSNMTDVVVILGRCQNMDTKEKYMGPCYIPKTVRVLRFEPNQEPIPLMFFVEKTVLSVERSKSVLIDFTSMRHEGDLDQLEF